VLNPKEKMVHFKKHWSEDLQQEVLDCAEEVVCGTSDFVLAVLKSRLWPHYQFQERYEEMNKAGPKPSVKRSKKSSMKSLLRELSDDDDDSDTTSMPSDNSDAPWHLEFRRYLDAVHELPEGMTSIQWWGVSLLSIARRL
jgi:hypothetical protein